MAKTLILLLVPLKTDIWMVQKYDWGNKEHWTTWYFVKKKIFHRSRQPLPQIHQIITKQTQIMMEPEAGGHVTLVTLQIAMRNNQHRETQKYSTKVLMIKQVSIQFAIGGSKSNQKNC